ncbi:MAG: hypothetical protein C0507_02620 [Cyanobacteria bacterium PR.3.49]|nr:hypothetical protein [Cyanobacteria bacterium PR.3.49]
MKLWQRLALLTLIPIVLQCFLLAQIRSAQEELDGAYAEERRQKDLMLLITKAVKSGFDTLSDMAGYKSSHSELKRQRAIFHVDQMRNICKQLALYGGNEAHIQKLIATMVEIEDTALSATDTDSESVNLRDITNMRQFTRLGRKIFATMELAHIEQEIRYKQMLVLVVAKRKHFEQMAFNSAVLCALISFAFAAYIVVLTNKQLAVLKKNSENLARGEKLLPQMKGRDELAEVDKTFHLMAHSINSLTERERAILKNSGEWIFTIDGKLRFSFVSEAVVGLVGMHPDELLGQHGSNLFGAATSSIEKARGEGHDVVFETELKNKSGAAVDIQISAHWSEQEQTYFCVAHDIGARKELERMKQSFMAMVSHDLRTPVASNLLTLDILKSDPQAGQLSQRGVTLVDRSIASNNRLMAMVNDLLELERLDSGQLKLDLELVTFNDLVDEALPAVEMLAKAKDINIDRDDSDAFVYCDSNRITQVLVNLLGNAIKFSPVGKPVSVRFSSDEQCDRIYVRDQGPGIDKESLPFIFDRFKQVKEQSGAHKQGFGLGLEICKKLVELHGGTISVESEPGQGTSFEIALPKHRPDA